MLEERLRNRGTDSEDDIARRLAKAAAEMERSPGFDVELVNDVLETATQELIQRTADFLGPAEPK